MQRAISNGWLDPALVAFAEEQHAQLGRKKGARLKPYGNLYRKPARLTQSNGNGGPRHSNRTGLRVSVMALLLSSAAFSYLAWSNTLASLPVASVIGLALGTTDSLANSSAAPPSTGTANQLSADSLAYADSGMASSGLSALTQSEAAASNANKTTPSRDLQEEVYHLRAENHALQSRLRDLQAQISQPLEDLDELQGTAGSD